MPQQQTGGGLFSGGRIRRPVPNERPHLTRCTKLVCSWFLSLLLVAGVLLFVVYLVVRPHRPRFHLTSFSASGLGGGGGPVVLSGQIAIRNPNHDLAFFFDRILMSIQYRDAEVVEGKDLTGGPLYQPPKTTAPVGFEGVAVPAGAATDLMARDAAGGGGGGGGHVAFTVRVRSRIRVRVAFWGSHWHPVHATCDVAVGPDGQMLPEFKDKRCGIDFF
uniref:Late embryogenesis abundant protein LEA-2 subgroup domain-containing protein n=1 Tax=Leersia perrieri TaxID=77586 RepID=A0A0D9W9W2_9ORYZ